jgi:hypothetical protein
MIPNPKVPHWKLKYSLYMDLKQKMINEYATQIDQKLKYLSKLEDFLKVTKSKAKNKKGESNFDKL